MEMGIQSCSAVKRTYDGVCWIVMMCGALCSMSAFSRRLMTNASSNKMSKKEEVGESTHTHT